MPLTTEEPASDGYKKNHANRTDNFTEMYLV